jgi:hypothetical protein
MLYWCSTQTNWADDDNTRGTMARTSLKVISVYLNDTDYDRVSRAAALADRSMSNYLKRAGIAQAKSDLARSQGRTTDDSATKRAPAGSTE